MGTSFDAGDNGLGVSEIIGEAKLSSSLRSPLKSGGALPRNMSMQAYEPSEQFTGEDERIESTEQTLPSARYEKPEKPERQERLERQEKEPRLEKQQKRPEKREEIKVVEARHERKSTADLPVIIYEGKKPPVQMQGE